MSKCYEFLSKCPFFCVATMEQNKPRVRPFGAVMEYREELYISTSNDKEVYKQLIENPFVQIIALKPETRLWIRINGIAVLQKDIGIKEKMLESCPVLLKHFKSATCPGFAVFCIKDKEVYICSDEGKEKLE